MRNLLRVLGLVVGILILPTAGIAQTRSLPVSSVLTIESDRLFEETAFGRRVLAEIEAETAVLAAEYRRIAAELTEEERTLTEKRSEMTLEDFRKVADAFDERVESIRATQEQREVDLAQRLNTERQRFLVLLRPVLEAVLSESKAVVVMEKRNLFASSESLDVTDLLIEQANLLIGDGSASPSDLEANEN